MARLRVHEKSPDEYEVPPELRDWDSAFWSDPVEFVRWAADNLAGTQVDRRIESLCGPAGHGPRFDFAVTEWALRNGFRSERYPNSVDRAQMEAAALRLMPALERCRRR